MSKRRVITEDDLDGLEAGGYGRDAKVHLELAATLEEWATQADRFALDGGLVPDDLLVRAGEHAAIAGDDDEVLRLLTLARQVARNDFPRFWMSDFLQLAKRRGTFAEALELLPEWKAAMGDDALEAHDVAEGLEACDEPVLAERWFNIAARWAEREAEAWLYEMAVVGRSRVRVAQGKPEDVQDVEAVEILALRQDNLERDLERDR